MPKLPQKKYYRQRAHANPMADHNFEYPVAPCTMDWSLLFPRHFPSSTKEVKFLDVGCGYGGLLVALAPLFPETLMIGLEIRVKVLSYIKNRILSLREKCSTSLQTVPGSYENIATIRTNAMKYLPNFFKKGQLSKLFFLYPDPHFKKAKHKWRIINQTLLAEYAYVLQEGGIVYTITDVKDLHDWIVYHFEKHPLFQSISLHELEDDSVLEKIYESTEEGKKVSRNNGEKYPAVFRRILDVQFP